MISFSLNSYTRMRSQELFKSHRILTSVVLAPLKIDNGL